jgi:hypothetical protein
MTKFKLMQKTNSSTSRRMVTFLLLTFTVPYILVICYIRLEVQRDAHEFLCILYFTINALHVSGAICTHHQEDKQQSTAVGTCDCYGVLEVGQSTGAGCGWDTLTLTTRSVDVTSPTTCNQPTAARARSSHQKLLV